MFLASLLRRIAFSYYDYKAYNFNIEKTDFVVIHIPDRSQSSLGKKLTI